MRVIVALLLASCLAPWNAWSQGAASDIFVKHQENLAAELGTYLDENPDAQDREAALLFLTNTLNVLNRSKESLDRYEELFELMAKRESVSISMVQSMVGLYALTGQRERGRKLVHRVEGMFPQEAGNPQFTQMIVRLENQLLRPLVGESLEMEFEDFTTGKKVNLEDLKGKIVFVHFWGTFSQPSVQQLPELAKIWRRYQNEDFAMVGVSVDIDRDRLQQVIRERNITWPQYCDGKAFDGKYTDKFRIRYVPASYLLDRNGTIIKSDIFGAQLELLLETLLDN